MIELIERKSYTERIIPFINKNIIKVLTGQRRVGKSCILYQQQQHITRTAIIHHQHFISITTLLR